MPGFYKTHFESKVHKIPNFWGDFAHFSNKKLHGSPATKQYALKSAIHDDS